MKKFLSLFAFLVVTANGFSQVVSPKVKTKNVEATTTLTLAGKVVNKISDDSTLAAKSNKSLVTEGAVKRYIDNKPAAGVTGTTNKIPFFTSGSTLGAVSNLHWDNANQRLGIKKSNPLYTLDVAGNGRIDNGYFYVKNGHVVLITDSTFLAAPELSYYGKRQSWRHGIDVANNGGTCDYVMLADDLGGFGVRDLIYVNRNKEGTNLVDDSSGYPSIGFWMTPASGRWISNGNFNPVVTQSLFNTPDIRPNRNTLGIRKSAYTTNNKMLAFYGSEDEVPDLWVNHNYEAGPFWSVRGNINVLSSDINNTNNLSLAANPSDTSSNFWMKNYYSGITGYQLKFRTGNKDFFKYSTSSDYSQFTGSLEATSFVKKGGTGSQFLKADGSVDNNVYQVAADLSATYLSKTGGTLTGLTRVQKSYSLAQNAFEIHYSDGNNYSMGIENYVKGSSNIAYKFNILNDVIASTPLIIDKDGLFAKSLNVLNLNTAPASSTAVGTKGEIRVTATYIYVCTATDTWVRAALSTW